VIGILEAINPLDPGFDPDALLVLTGIGSLAGNAISTPSFSSACRLLNNCVRI
jgi:hypothetical protein